MEDIVSIILWPTLDKRFIAKKIPIAISHNDSFLVDTEKLADCQDILSDDMGAWKNNRFDSIHVTVSKTETEVQNVQRLQSST